MKLVTIIGNKIGSLRFLEKGIKDVSIIHIVDEYRPNGPAENSILLLTTKTDGTVHASYIPWVGYFDLDKENIKRKGKWEIVEPPGKIKLKQVEWEPFVNEN